MDVRVCGPNLRDQSKGSFHVHRHDCTDLKHYGPGGKYGGDCDGMNEMLVKDATVVKVVMHTYDDQIGERMDQDESLADVIDEFASDFWFAPCCFDAVPYGDVSKNLPSEAEIVTTVYECSAQSTFVKLTTQEEVAAWVAETLPTLHTHERLSIVPHLSDEYH